MTPPLVCPSPEPSRREGPARQARQKDCPLYEQRAITPDEYLRRAVLVERHKHGDGLAELVRAEAAPPALPPIRPALHPAPESPLPLPVFDHMKGATRR